jgi:hypothetical protein
MQGDNHSIVDKQPSIRIRIIPSAYTPDVMLVRYFDVMHHTHNEAHVPRVGRFTSE